MLSKYLSLKEAITSRTAKKYGIDNTPNEDQKESLKLLAVNIFDPVREFIGRPLGVNSAFRSEELNRKILGAKNSQHTKGEALDIDADVYGNGDNESIFFFIKDNLNFDQLIAEHKQSGKPAWVHVSYKKEGNRGQVLIATKRGRKTVYIPYSKKQYNQIYG